jgi:hypothetical protein
MADHLGHQGCLGHQKLKTEYFAGPSVFLPWKVTGIIKNGAAMPQDITLSIVLKFFVKKHDFFAFGAFFVLGNHVFRQFFCHFLRIGILFFS